MQKNNKFENNIREYHKVELLAPAGSPEGFYGAIHGGADAVYLAGNRFGARAYAENFTTEKLVECIRYAHLLGRKIYLTVNTLLKEAEMAELYDYLLPFYEAGLDAVIVQDLGVFRFIREHFPGLELHVSTQMTICSGDGASLLKEMGASRIVPARELSLKEIVQMKEASGLEMETFIHGAMCYCYSGQCLFSSILGGRSGNRGRCAQPCRLPYTVKTKAATKENCYPLSLKDMCTIEHLPALIEAGIDSFKIEGRMKKPEYTAGVTSIYRKYIDKYYELRERLGAEEAAKAYKVSKEDLNILRSLYIRSDIQDGYYYKHNGKEMVTMTNPAYSGSDEELLQRVHDKFLANNLKMPIQVEASFQTGTPAKVTMSWQDVSICAEGEVVSQAQKQPISEENVKKQLNKLGDTAFYATEIVVSISDDAFYPLKQINELRRRAVELLEEQILFYRGYDKTYTAKNKNADDDHSTSASTKAYNIEPIASKNENNPNIFPATGYTISIRTLAQLEAFGAWLEENPQAVAQIIRLYVDGDLLEDEWDSVLAQLSKLPKTCQVWIALPYILRARDNNYLEKLYRKATEHKIIQGFLVRSMDGLGFLKRMGSSFPCRSDAGVYVWNTNALKEVSERVEGICLPYELKASEQKPLLGDTPCEKIVYSRIPMMITANCLLRTVDKCNPNSTEMVTLTDRYHKEFKVLRNCKHCMNIIYNSVPFVLHQELTKWKGRVDLRMDFTYEPADEVKRVLDSFVNGFPFTEKDYTTGHEKRGVE